MGPQFSQLLAYYEDTVIAMGPLGHDDTPVPDYVEELHAWIYQEASLTADAVAMPSTGAGTPVLQEAGKCWMVPLTAITPVTKPDFAFHQGRAFAVAIAMFSNDASSQAPRAIGLKEGHVIWWGHPVQLLESEDAVTDAIGPEYRRNPGAGFDEITKKLQVLWDANHPVAPQSPSGGSTTGQARSRPGDATRRAPTARRGRS